MNEGIRKLLPSVLALVLLLAACGSDESSPTTTAPVDDDSTIVIGGMRLPAVDFIDSDGAYSMRIDPNWDTAHNAVSPGQEVFVVDVVNDDFGANLNILTHLEMFDRDSFVDLTLHTAEETMTDFVLHDRSIVVTDDGRELVVLDFTGTTPRRTLRFLEFIDQRDGVVVAATFAAEPDRFEVLVGRVRPYMETLGPA